jgi:uncharacterized FlgJ-related protein
VNVVIIVSRYFKKNNYFLFFFAVFFASLYSLPLSSRKPLPFSPGFCPSSVSLPTSLKEQEIRLAAHRQTLWNQKIHIQKRSEQPLHIKIDQARFQQWIKRSHISSGNRRFIQNIFQLLFLENQKILRERRCIQKWLDLRKEKQPLTAGDKAYFGILKKKYQASSLDELWIKADVVPISMAVAQSIEESGWGKAKIAQKRRSYFGMCQRNAVISYQNSQDCVAHYLNNLNRHASYSKMRRLRAQLRLQKKPITGKALLPTLSAYSVYKRYIAKIALIMNAYRLSELDAWIF